MGRITPMKNNDFAVFILTHGRPDNVITFETLKRQGYTGEIYIICDNEDKTIEQYRQRFGDKVIVFDKAEIEKKIDTGDNFGDRRTILHARNACFEIAKELGLKYFLQLDDDYYEFQYKINHKMEYPTNHLTVLSNLGNVFDSFFTYYKSIGAKSIALSQGGDFFGGKDGFGKSKRKCMNTFFCSVDRPFQFRGTMNEDVNTYTSLGKNGDLFLSIHFAMMNQMDTQSSSGGITELYKKFGTYVKSFYTVMYSPSCTKISMMGSTHRRLHHKIKWDHAVPFIVPESARKPTIINA